MKTIYIQKGQEALIQLDNLIDVKLYDAPNWQILDGIGTIQPEQGQLLAHIRDVDDTLLVGVTAYVKTPGEINPKLVSDVFQVIVSRNLPATIEAAQVI